MQGRSFGIALGLTRRTVSPATTAAPARRTTGRPHTGSRRTAVPLPEDVVSLVSRLRERLEEVEDDDPLNALRIVGEPRDPSPTVARPRADAQTGGDPRQPGRPPLGGQGTGLAR